MSNLNTMPDPYQFLERISTEELQRILREDFESEDEGTAENDEFITKVMEVVEKREKSAQIFDPVKGWMDFQKNYYPTEENPVDAELEALNQKHRVIKSVSRNSASGPIRHVKRIAFVASVAIGVFVSLLVAAQASGFDVFGAMARWTDEAFHFVTAPTTNHEVEEFCSALNEQGIPAEYALTWLPDGFVADEPKIEVFKRQTMISNRFSDGESEILFIVTQYHSKDAIDIAGYEKENGEAIPYMNGKQLFYIFDNIDRTAAAWSDGHTFAIDIFGQISIDDMKSIIDSIGG